LHIIHVISPKNELDDLPELPSLRLISANHDQNALFAVCLHFFMVFAFNIQKTAKFSLIPYYFCAKNSSNRRKSQRIEENFRYHKICANILTQNQKTLATS